MRHILSDNRNILSFQTFFMPLEMKKIPNFLKNINERDRDISDFVNNFDISTLWLYRVNFSAKMHQIS